PRIRSDLCSDWGWGYGQPGGCKDRNGCAGNGDVAECPGGDGDVNEERRGIPRYAGDGAFFWREIAGQCARGDDAYRASLGALVDADGMRACGNCGGTARCRRGGRRLDGSVYCRD